MDLVDKLFFEKTDIFYPLVSLIPGQIDRIYFTLADEFVSLFSSLLNTSTNK